MTPSEEEKEAGPKPLKTTDSTRVILFFQDTDEVEVMDAQAAITEYGIDLDEPRDKAPKMGNWMDIYENSSSEKDRGLVMTVLNLNQLGWANTCLRLIGRCTYIYVLNRAGNPPR